MSRRYQKSEGIRNSFSKRTRIRGQAEARAREVQLPLDVESLVEMSRTALSSFAAEVGLLVAQRLLEDEVTQLCGERHERRKQREMTRFGHQGGHLTFAGQKGRIQKPRVRYVKRRGEVELERYRLFQSPDAMPQAALIQLVNGVSTYRYERVVDLAREAYVVKKSSVNRGFIRTSATEVKCLAERMFDDERFAAIFIDAQSYAGEMMVVALGITVQGAKRTLACGRERRRMPRLLRHF